MKLIFICLLMLVPFDLYAGAGVDGVDKTIAILNKRWNDCIAQSANSEVYKCLRPTALEAANMNDKFAAWHQARLLKLPNGEAKAAQLARSYKASIQYMSAHCKLISILAVETEDRQKAHCHFKTHLEIAHTLALFLED